MWKWGCCLSRWQNRLFKKPVSLDGFIKALDQTIIRASNKADMKVSDGMDIEDRNRMSVIIRPQFKNKVVGGIENKVDIEDSYRLDLLISKNDYIKNFFSRNLVNILANLFKNLSPTSIDFRSSPAFPVSFSYLATSDGINSCKALDSISLVVLTTYNLSNILIFYHWLFVYLTVKPPTNIISTDSSYFISDSIQIK